MTEVPELARLVQESRWIHALARSLVADVHLADDLAQDTLVAALGHAGPVGAWRAFLATGLRRRLGERRRTDAARAAREQQAARREALPSTLAMVERAGVQRDLVQAVLELEEPYRTAILWRFFEELPPREIARRSGAPLATVHTRIQRGLARLRERLARTRGASDAPDGGWALALVPLLAPPPQALVPASAAPLLPALLMKSSAQIGLCALLLAGGAFVAWRATRPTGSTPGSGAGPELAAEPAPALASAPARSEPEVEAEREAVPATPAPAVDVPRPQEVAAPNVRRVAGRALDAYGRGLAGVELVARPGDERFRSGNGGHFELQLAASARTLESADARYATVLAGAAETAAETGSLVVLAPRLALSGRVLDEAGAGLAGAELSVRLPKGFGADFGLALDGALTREWSAVSGAGGAFSMPDAPSVEGARLVAQLGGFAALDEALPALSRDDLLLTLVRVRGAAELVRGVVLLPDGDPAAEARVAFGVTTTVADANGRFELAATDGERPACVRALLPGFQPALATREEFGGTWPGELTLRLGGDLLAIEGRVFGPDGVPVPHARVWLAEPTWFGALEGDVIAVETLLGGGERRFWAYVETDGDGSFALTGLGTRDYRLKVVDPHSLLLLETEPIAAGTRDVRLQFPADELHARVRGRVLAPDGAGIPGVLVKVERPALTFEFPDGGTRDQYTTGQEVTTDAQGGFEFVDVPRGGVELFASGDAILFAALELGPELDPEAAVIRAERRVHLQVELTPALDSTGLARADQLRVLDGDGRGLLLRVMRGSTAHSNSVVSLEDGRSHVLSLSERARWIVLYRGAAEVARLPFAPAPSGVNTVRW